MNNKKEPKQKIVLYVNKMQVFVLLIIAGFFFGGLYVNAAPVSHDASEIEIDDYDGNVKTLQQAINDFSLGAPGNDGRITHEACRLCVDKKSIPSEEDHEIVEGTCDSGNYGDDWAHWTNYRGWVAGFTIEPYNSGKKAGGSRRRSTGYNCVDDDSDWHCDITGEHCSSVNCPGQCCVLVSDPAEWNSEGQHCYSYYWEEVPTWYTENQATNTYGPFDWYQPDVVNLCCK